MAFAEPYDDGMKPEIEVPRHVRDIGELEAENARLTAEAAAIQQGFCEVRAFLAGMITDRFPGMQYSKGWSAGICACLDHFDRISTRVLSKDAGSALLSEMEALRAEVERERNIRKAAEQETHHHALRTGELYLEREALRARVAELEAALEQVRVYFNYCPPEEKWIHNTVAAALERKAGGKPTMEQEKNEHAI